MTQQQFEYEVMSQLETMQYAEFLRSNSDQLICNSDAMIQAIEDGYMYEDFQKEQSWKKD